MVIVISVAAAVMFFLYSGGVWLSFSGNNLDVAQNPLLILNGESVSFDDSSHACTHTTLLPCMQSPCVEVGMNTLNCTTPSVGSVQAMVFYMLVLDDAPFPDLQDFPELQLEVRPDPTGFRLVTQTVGVDSNLVQIEVSKRPCMWCVVARTIVQYQTMKHCIAFTLIMSTFNNAFHK